VHRGGTCRRNSAIGIRSFGQFQRWADSGVWDVILEALAGIGVGGATLQMIDATIIRAHHCAGGGKGGSSATLGRSRGGFSTKINARTNAEGLPIGSEITPGQTHDVTAYPALMDDIDCDPEQMLGDKGYDSKAVRQDIEQRQGAAVIPSLASRKIQHAVDKAVYAPAQPHRTLLQSC
jgi:transposase